MELSTIIMAVVAIGVIGIPLYLLAKSGSKEKQSIMKQFKTIGEGLGLVNIESDGWNDMVFGIDRGSRKILVYKNNKGTEEQWLFDLQEIENCKKVNVSRSVKLNSGVSNVVDSLGLELVRKGGQPPVLIEFYNSKNSFILSNELQLIEKWSKTINELIKK
jgi:hypothetical protein